MYLHFIIEWIRFAAYIIYFASLSPYIWLCFVIKCGKDRLSMNVCVAVNYQQTLEETEWTIQWNWQHWVEIGSKLERITLSTFWLFSFISLYRYIITITDEPKHRPVVVVSILSKLFKMFLCKFNYFSKRLHQASQRLETYCFCSVS